MSRSRLSRRFWLITLASAAVALTTLSLGDARGLSKLAGLKTEISNYDRKCRALREENAALQREIQALRPDGDLAAIERAAREDLGLVKPNELVFNLVPSPELR